MIIKVIINWISKNIRFAISEKPQGKILFVCNLPTIEGYLVIFVGAHLLGCIKY